LLQTFQSKARATIPWQEADSKSDVFEKRLSMAKLASISIPTEPIDSIPRLLDLIERVAQVGREDPDPASFYGGEE